MNPTEEPRQLVLQDDPMMLYPKLAKLIGLNQAIILAQIKYWMYHKTPDGKQMGIEADGVRWIRNTAEQWQESNFIFWSTKTVGRILNGMVKDGLLLSRSDLNKKGYDRTKWYTINWQKLNSIYPFWAIAFTQVVQMEGDSLGITIPETTSETTRYPLGEATPPPTGAPQESSNFPFVSKYSETKLHQRYGRFLKYRRDDDPDFKDPRLYHPALRIWRGAYKQDVTPKGNWRDRVINKVGYHEGHLKVWRTSIEVWTGISENPSPMRVLSIFDNGGVLNDREDFMRQQKAASQDNEVQQVNPLSKEYLAERMAGWQRLQASGALEKG